MYEKYLQQIEEAGKIRNLTQSTINSYRNFVSSFLTYMNKNPEELTCQDVRRFLLEKKDNIICSIRLNRKWCKRKGNSLEIPTLLFRLHHHRF